jgi:hypothetical protein
MELQQSDSFRSGIPKTPKNSALAAAFNLPVFVKVLLISMTNTAIGVIGTQYSAFTSGRSGGALRGGDFYKDRG